MINQRNVIIFILFILIIHNTGQPHIETFNPIDGFVNLVSNSILYPLEAVTNFAKKVLDSPSESIGIVIPDKIPNYDDQ